MPKYTRIEAMRAFWAAVSQWEDDTRRIRSQLPGATLRAAVEVIQNGADPRTVVGDMERPHMPRFLYMEACPALRGKARRFGRRYRKLAVVELEPGFAGRPKMISERAIGVRRVVECTTVHVGRTSRSAGVQTMLRFRALVDALNAVDA